MIPDFNHFLRHYFRIPKGFRPRAQGCGGRRGATLGTVAIGINNPNGVVAFCLVLHAELHLPIIRRFAIVAS